jgi:hypothetical protein
MSGARVWVRSRTDLARQRRPRRHACWDHLIAVAGSLVLYRLAGFL